MRQKTKVQLTVKEREKVCEDDECGPTHSGGTMWSFSAASCSSPWTSRILAVRYNCPGTELIPVLLSPLGLLEFTEPLLDPDGTQQQQQQQQPPPPSVPELYTLCFLQVPAATLRPPTESLQQLLLQVMTTHTETGYFYLKKRYFKI